MRGECGDRGGERGRKKIPTESQEEGESRRDCEGNISLLQLGRKLLETDWRWGGGGGGAGAGEETEAKGGRDRFGFGHNLPESREAGAGCDPAGRRPMTTAGVYREACGENR